MTARASNRGARLPGGPDGRGLAVAPEPDALSDVLRNVRLSGALFFLWDVTSPFATPVPAGRSFANALLPGAQQIVSYHVVVSGSCWGGLIGEPPVRLEAGDTLLVPHGHAYAMADTEHACAGARVDLPLALEFFRGISTRGLPPVVREGGGGQSTRVVCGFLGCDTRPFNPLVAALPALLRVAPPLGAKRDRLRGLVEFALAEARSPEPGRRGVLLRLSELMFVEVLRRHVAGSEHPGQGWLASLHDPVVGRALALMHGEPAAPWTLQSLATAVNVSRSTLADVFARRVGHPPMRYLTRWRLQLAARMLADGPAKVAAVAREVGYESEAAFSRAFKRFVGVSPVRWREQSGSAP